MVCTSITRVVKYLKNMYPSTVKLNPTKANITCCFCLSFIVVTERSRIQVGRGVWGYEEVYSVFFTSGWESADFSSDDSAGLSSAVGVEEGPDDSLANFALAATA